MRLYLKKTLGISSLVLCLLGSNLMAATITPTPPSSPAKQTTPAVALPPALPPAPTTKAVEVPPSQTPPRTLNRDRQTKGALNKKLPLTHKPAKKASPSLKEQLQMKIQNSSSTSTSSAVQRNQEIKWQSGTGASTTNTGYYRTQSSAIPKTAPAVSGETQRNQNIQWPSTNTNTSRY